jgi:uncharacterized membrane protein
VSDAALTRKPVSRPEEGVGVVRRRLSSHVGEDAVALRVVCVAVAAYAVLFLFATTVHFEVFQTARFDLGNMVQAIWNSLHGHLLETTTQNGHQHSRLGFHADPFLLVLVPFFWIWSSPLLLLVVQVLAVASGALPVFWLARKHLASPRAGAQFAVAYLLYPATQFNAFTNGSDFHSVSIAIPRVLYAIWFLDEDRLLPFASFALLACTTKEEIPLAVGGLGIWYAVRKGRRLFGIGVFASGLAMTLFNFLWLIPHLAPKGVEPFAGRYTAVGGTPRGIAHELFSDPVAFAHAVLTGHKAIYIALLLVPFLGLWLLEPLLLLGAVPDLAINLLSSEGNQTSLQFQYTAGILPFLVAASIFGAARFERRRVELSLWVLTGVTAIAVFSPLASTVHDLRALNSRRVSAEARAISLIPRGVPVSATNKLGSYLSERRRIYSFPYVRKSRWIIIDLSDSTYIDRAGFQRVAREYKSAKGWRTIFSSNGISVLHERPPAKR